MSFNAVLGQTKTQVLQSKHYLHAFNCRNIPSAVYVTSCNILSLPKHAFCALSKQGLLNSDRIDKNMTIVGKSRIVVGGRCLLLAETLLK